MSPIRSREARENRLRELLDAFRDQIRLEQEEAADAVLEQIVDEFAGEDT